ncbi:MAG: hypothetical protein J7500_15550 [Sphingomonas sp.]|uniref:hypothetical protein n=1 Tax=Sphingomonas sp. TaxID=28214 RepID=UPI001B249C01|nr:hypothetical protein [Sphingomonas sp.]MBO9624122.1 hypothetical protein [Sphingomonas sp.]
MELTLDRDAIREAIIVRAYEEISGDWDFRDEIRAEIKRRVDGVFATTVKEEVASAVREAVQSGFDREYQKVDSFGAAKGPETTIRKELERLIEGYWSQRVDSTGKPTESSYSSTTRAEWMMTQICGEKFKDDMKAAMVSQTAALKDGLRAKLRASTDEMLGQLFRVQTAQDKAEGRYC